MGTELTDNRKGWGMELGGVRCLDLSGVPSGKGSENFSPTDLRGEYAVGDRAVNYQNLNKK